jgi:hypothetical protein
MRIRWRPLPWLQLPARTSHTPRGSIHAAPHRPCLTAKSFGCVPFTRGKKRPRQNGHLKNGPFESRLLCPQPMRSCCFPPCILPRRCRHFAASVAHAAACTKCAPNSRSEQGCCVTALSQVLISALSWCAHERGSGGAPARGAGGGIGHGRSAPSANVLPQAHGDGATLGRSWAELHIARRRHLSVAPPADRMSSSSSPTRCARRRCAGLDDRLGSSEVCCSTPWPPCRQRFVSGPNKASSILACLTAYRGYKLSCQERQIGRVRNVLERRSQGRRS